jgi:putative endonuclease
MRETFQPCAYILASRRHGTLYIGVNSNLLGRIQQHREGLIKGFTSRYCVYRLIEETNLDWDDLAIGLGLPPFRHSREGGKP